MRSVATSPGQVSDADRITRLGAFLRKTSLDELPSLWNVVNGTMSLVGPRPLPPNYLPFYTPEEQLRHTVRPGITGLAQVSGRNTLDWDTRFAKDVEYTKTCSFRQDLLILGRTIKRVASADGVLVNPSASMRDLDVDRKWMELD
jgi:lipopolysaccharide/colanic/teichoic acid biosynthesis glycosyltransferase